MDIEKNLKNNIMFPDYNNCLANIPNSILKWFGLEPVGASLPMLDDLLKKDYKNVVLLLLDGMGTAIMNEHLATNGPFRQHQIGAISSVFLSTTTAGTTSAITGLQPCEHCWLGWDCYIPQIDQNVTIFRNTLEGTDIPAADYNVAHTYMKYESVVDKINKSGYQAYSSMPFLPPFPDSLDAICDRISSLCSQDGKKYIYSYWNQPDGALHHYGLRTDSVHNLLHELENHVDKLASELTSRGDTLFIITADHGHIDNRITFLKDYPEILDCLIRQPSLEPRALNLFVKSDKCQKFEELFNKEFGKDFLLLPMDEMLAKNLMGDRPWNEKFRAMLGNYIAIAISDLSIYFTDECHLSMHGGITKKEMEIPLIIYG